jgi:isopropylmalate/homocitrate/citramalate synthase
MYSSILKNPPLRLFDVTLRDGFQSSSKIYSLVEKIKLGLDIIVDRNPRAIEIGSFVSSNMDFQTKKSIDLFQSFSSSYGVRNNLDIFLLTPNYKSTQLAINHHVCNYSFITSVSNVFQKQNTNFTISDNKIEIQNMVDLVKTTNEDNKIKLYIYCFTECPILGKIDNHTIISEIMYYYHTYGKQLSNICLSDTCGTLRFQDFKFIIDHLILKGVNLEQFGLHLYQQSSHDNVKQMILYAMRNGISQFDVSHHSETTHDSSVIKKNPSNNIGYEVMYECL